MDILRGLAMGAQAYTEAKARQQAREDALRQQAFQNMMQERAAALQQKTAEASIANLLFNQGMASREAQYREGAEARANRMADAELMRQENARRARGREALGTISDMLLGTTRVSPAPASFADKPQGLTIPEMLGRLVQPTPQPVPVPQESFVPPDDRTRQPWPPVQAPAPKGTKQQARIRTTAAQPAGPVGGREMTDAEKLAGLYGAEGLVTTVGPEGPTFQRVSPTAAQKVAVRGAELQNEAARQQIEQAAAFLPFRIQAADLANQLSTVEVALKQFQLAQAPEQAREQLLNLQKLELALDLARTTNPLQVDRLKGEIAQLKAQTGLVGAQTKAIPAEIGLRQRQLSLQAGNQSADNARADRQLALQERAAAQKPAVPRATFDQQMQATKFIAGQVDGAVKATSEGEVPSLAEIDALGDQIVAFSSGEPPLIAGSSANVLLAKLAAVRRVAEQQAKEAAGSVSATEPAPWWRFWDRTPVPVPAGPATPTIRPPRAKPRNSEDGG